MSRLHTSRRIVVVTEIIATIAAAIGWGSTGAQPALAASPAAPAIASTIPAPSDILIDSPWVVDSTGMTAWALGVHANGTGALVRRDIATNALSYTDTLAGEGGATDGELIAPTGNIVFIAKRPGAGGRVIVFNPSTNARVASFDLATQDFAPRAIGYNPTGSQIYVGNFPAGTAVLQRINSTTGASAGTVSFAAALGPISTGFMYNSMLWLSTSTSPTKLQSFKWTTNLMVDSTTTLPTGLPPLVDTIVVGSTAWSGTDTNPGRLVGLDLTTKTVGANFPLDTDEVGLRNLAVTADGSTVYGTTTVNGHTRLVSFRLSDGARLGNVDLPGYAGATSISVTGRFVDVLFPGTTSIVRLTTAPAPTAPDEATLTEGDQSVAVHWSASTSVEPDVVYTATATGNSGTSTCTTTTTGCTLTGLTNGETYSVSVVASSVAGVSEASLVLTASPFTVPESPVIEAVARGDQRVTVSWVPPANGGRPIIDYSATLQPGGFTCVTTEVTCEFTGLSNGTPYELVVRARSSAGESAASSWGRLIVPATTPGRVIDVAAVRGNHEVTLSWSPPTTDGGEPVNGYIVRDGNGSLVCRTVEPRCVVASLVNGVPVQFSVVATNAVGDSANPELSTVVIPASRPTAPDFVTVANENAKGIVYWSAPRDFGGVDILGYRATVWDDATDVSTVNTTGLMAEFTGLENGRSYRVTVEAFNAVGSSERATTWLAPIAPPAPPPPPVPPTPEPPLPPVEPEPPIVIPTPTPTPTVSPTPTPEPTVPPALYPRKTVPAAPTGIRLKSFTKSTVVLEWDMPLAGGSTIRDYRIETRSTPLSSFAVVNDGMSARRTVSLPRPRSGRSLYIRISAINSIGRSVPSAVYRWTGTVLTRFGG